MKRNRSRSPHSPPAPQVRAIKGYWKFRYRDADGQHNLSFGSTSKVAKAIADTELRRALEQRADPQSSSSGLVKVSEACQQYVTWAEDFYVRDDGTQTGEAGNLMAGLQPLVNLFPEIPAAHLRPRHIKEFCEAQAQDKVSRPVINKRIGYIKRMLKWAKNEEIIPPARLPGDTVAVGAFDSCRDFPLIKKGRPVRAGGTIARETKPVVAVAVETAAQTIRFLPDTVRLMVELQQLTSMRPAEVCALKMTEVDVERTPWLYEPGQHKTKHRGKVRRIYFGPKARELLKPYILRRDSYVFRPRDAKTAAVGLGLRAAGDRYTTRSYRDAIWRACDRAFPAPEDIRGMAGQLKASAAKRKTRKYQGLAAAAQQKIAEKEKALAADARKERRWKSAHRWSPNQLRHGGLSEIVDRELAAATERATAVAGHSSAQTTKGYLHLKDQLAAAVMEQSG